MGLGLFVRRFLGLVGLPVLAVCKEVGLITIRFVGILGVVNLSAAGCVDTGVPVNGRVVSAVFGLVALKEVGVAITVVGVSVFKVLGAGVVASDGLAVIRVVSKVICALVGVAVLSVVVIGVCAFVRGVVAAVGLVVRALVGAIVVLFFLFFLGFLVFFGFLAFLVGLSLLFR